MTRTIRAAALFVVAVCAWAAYLAAQGQPPAPAPDGIVARIDGRAVTAADVDTKWRELDPSGFARFSMEQYESRRRVLDVMITDRLLERAAAARGVTKDALVQQEVAKRSKPVTDAEIEQTYKSAQARYPNTTLDQLREPIRQYLQQQQRDLVIRAIVDETKKAGAAVDIVMDVPRQAVAVEATDPVQGPATADVEIVEFSDFQCPFCLSALPMIKQIQSTFGDRVRFVYRDLPLNIHPNAMQAAEAAQCAREQGKFWEYHDRLFANQKALDSDHLKQYARDLGLDASAFNACVDQRKMKALVEADMAAAQRYGVDSTPAFFVNGRMLLGAQPFDAFRQAVQDEIDRKAARSRKD